MKSLLYFLFLALQKFCSFISSLCFKSFIPFQHKLYKHALLIELLEWKDGPWKGATDSLILCVYQLGHSRCSDKWYHYSACHTKASSNAYCGKQFTFIIFSLLLCLIYCFVNGNIRVNMLEAFMFWTVWY